MVDAAVYLEELCRDLIAIVHQEGGPSIALETDIDNEFLTTERAIPIGLIVNELVTNAVKYGALSNTSGHIDIGWRLVERNDYQVELTWQESGGPIVRHGAAGFGTKLIDRVLHDIGAEIEMKFDPQGLHCRLAFPLQRTRARHTHERALAERALVAIGPASEKPVLDELKGDKMLSVQFSTSSADRDAAAKLVRVALSRL